MAEHNLTELDPEKYLTRLDRWREQKQEMAAAPLPAINLLADLRAQIDQLFGTQAAGLGPRLREIEARVTALFPADPLAQLSEKQKGAIRGQLELDFEELEDLLYALHVARREGRAW